jgi:hypothetical protein
MATQFRRIEVAGVGRYSRTRIAVPGGTLSERLFPQEKATLQNLHLGT